jgi:hypothetical protein
MGPNVLPHMASSCHGRLVSERGAALLLVIVLSAIALAIMTTVLYMVTVGTQLSGSEKRYRTAHEAGMACIEVLNQTIENQARINLPGITIVWPNNSFDAKMASPDLSADGLDTTRTIDPDTSTTYDVAVDMGNPVYRCFAKMVSKRPGNTQRGYKNVGIKTGVVPGVPQGGQQIIPTFYTFFILTQKATNASERVKMDLVSVF